MKSLGSLAISFIIGVAVGLAVSWYGPGNLLKTGEKGLNAGVQVINQEKYDSCKASFLEETQCIQKEPLPVCDEKITDRCGIDPGLKERKSKR